MEVQYNYKKFLEEYLEDEQNESKFKTLEELVTFLEKTFLPNYLRKSASTSKSKNGNRSPYFYICLSNLLNFSLSKPELDYAFSYFASKQIWVNGYDASVTEKFENYNSTKTYKNKKSLDTMSQETLEKKLVEYQRTNDIRLRNEIVERSTKLASYLAYKYSLSTRIDYEELESYANEGLILATEKYDLNLECKFSTFAFMYIQFYILNATPKIKGLAKRKLYEKYRNALKEVSESNDKDELSEELFLEKVAEKMGGIKQECKQNLYHYNYVALLNMASIEEFIELEQNEEDAEVLGNDFVLEPYFEVEKQLLRNDLEEALSLLTKKEQTVLRLYFGFTQEGPMTLEKIAQIQNVTAEAVRQTKLRAFDKINNSEKFEKVKKKLKEYL